MKTKKLPNTLFIFHFALFASAITVFVAITASPVCALDLQDEHLSEEQRCYIASPNVFFAQAWQLIHDDYYDRSFNGQDWNRWKEHFKGKLRTQEDACVAIDTMLASLKPSKNHLFRIDRETRCGYFPEVFGVGLAIDPHERVVVRSIPASLSTAGKLQLLPGDIIEAVDGKPLQRYPQDMRRVTEKIRGVADSTVELTIQRDGQQRKLEERRSFTWQSVSGMLENNVGYINLDFMSLSYSKDTIQRIEAAFNSIRKSKGLIVDFRDNVGVGGEGKAIVKQVSKLLLSRKFRKPIVFLVNEGTPQAAVRICSILRQKQRGLLVGERTQGIQDPITAIFVLEGGFCMLIDRERSKSNHALPVTQRLDPDYEVELTKADLLNGKGPWWYTQQQLPKAEKIVEDIQLKRAMEVIRGS